MFGDTPRNGLVRRMERRSFIWLAITSLAFVSVSLGLFTVPETGIQYWYLYFSPLVLAAFSFGLRGALAGSAASMVAILLLYRFASETHLPMLSFLQQLAATADSPAELQAFAVRVADLRANDPITAFARALSGGVLLTVTGVLLGLVVDRTRSQEVTERAARQLQRYFSPQVAQAVLTGHSEAGLSTTRKEVTVLFADLRGFSALAERVEPEELMLLLNQYLSAMTEIVFKYDGTLDKYLGDGLMAFFGDPAPHEDHAERALRAALEMRGRFWELRSLWFTEGRENIHMGIGISSGYVTVGNIGSPSRLEYTVIGNTVNIASHLADTAGPDQILTPRHTYAKGQHIMEARTLGLQTVAGVGHAVEVMDVLGSRLVATEQSETLGRFPGEKAALEAVLDRIVDDGALRALVLSSPDRALAGTTLNHEEQRTAQQVAALRGYPLFREVSAQEMLLLMRLVNVEAFRDGTVITRQGEKEDRFYIVYRGELAVIVIDAAGREQHIATLGRGTHFGELALLYGTPRNATVRANSDLELLTLDQPRFQQILTEAPVLSMNIQQEARRRLTAS